jgi:AraC-like DNA-binding protein
MSGIDANPAWDLLSDLFAAQPLGASAIAVFRMAEPWGLAVPHFGAALLYAVLEGRLQIEVDNGPPSLAEEGDVVLIVGGAAHIVRSGPHAPARHVLDVLAEHGVRPWTPGERAEAPILLDLAGEEPATRFLVVLMDFRDAAPGFLRLNLPALIHLTAAENRMTPWLAPAVDSIVGGLAQGRIGYLALTAKLAELVFINSIRTHLVLRPEAASGWLQALTQPQLARALALMHRDPASRWSVQTLARTAGMSRSAFAAAFTRVMGQTPFAYLTDLRMRLAADRIASGRSSVKAAAQALGYASDKAFSQAFRRARGRKPSSLKPVRGAPDLR